MLLMWSDVIQRIVNKHAASTSGHKRSCSCVCCAQFRVRAKRFLCALFNERGAWRSPKT